MKVVILAGGFGTRIGEETHLKPKPMIEIGGKPILWHIMKIYSQYGFNEFVICLGYKSHVIKEFFADYYFYMSDITFDFSQNNKMTIHNNIAEPWKVTLVDTGLETMTGSRIKRVKDYLDNEPFLLTYGDGVCDVDIKAVVEFHKSHEKKATITTVQPSGRFGVVDTHENGSVHCFREKSKDDMGWINGGFMVLDFSVLDLIKDVNTVFEQETLEILANNSQLMAYKHSGFWQCLDTLRDKIYLEQLWNSGNAPWKVWQE